MTWPARLRAAAIAVLAACALGPRAEQRIDEPPAAGAAAPAPTSARELREETAWIDVSVADLYGRRETRRIPVTLFKPAGAGPFPLVIMNHGRASSERRARQGRQRYEPLSRYFVAKGFVVMLPTRVGYADTYGDFDPESIGSCNNPKLEPQAEAASEQVIATLAYAKTLPFVDTSRWIVAGQSVGGLTAVATVWHRPAGLVGGINFSGGTGGDPDRSPGRPCQPDRIAAFWGRQAAAAAGVPMLWLYWENDEYWGPENPKRWHAAWIAGGGQAEFHAMAAVGEKGHNAVNVDAAHWRPVVDAWLAGLGFTASAPPPPPASLPASAPASAAAGGEVAPSKP